MRYIYGNFTDQQIKGAVAIMHDDIHKLLLYKDKNINYPIFESDKEYFKYFNNLLFRFGGLNKLFGEPPQLVAFMSTLQGAYDEVLRDKFRWYKFRRAILDCHGYLKEMFESEVIDECQV